MTSSSPLLKKTAGWLTHLYTALGMVAAAGMIVCITNGGADNFRHAFVFMAVALFIDATDGTFARALDIKHTVPSFDGRRLDDIVDYQTYTSIPLFLIWKAGLVPAGSEWCLVFAAVASLYGFCQVNAKTEDGYFLGFPSYWNLIAFYLYLLPGPGWVTVGLITGLAALTFVPSRYLYPSQGGKLNMITNGLGAIWAAMLVWVYFRMPLGVRPGAETFWPAVISLFFPVYYLVASWVITVQVYVRERNKPTLVETLREIGQTMRDTLKYKGVVFDMDGTLVDTEPMHHQAYIRAVQQFGVAFPESEYNQFTGSTDAAICKYLIERHNLQISAEELLRQKEAIFIELVRATRLTPLPGVVQTLEQFEFLGTEIACASSATLEAIEAVLEAAGIRHFFRVIASGEEVENSKPAPDVFLLAAQRAGIAPELWLGFEDSQNGGIALKNAGMYCVAIPCGGTKQQNHDHADLVLSSMAEVDCGSLVLN
jgi:phosphatidylcholine synthase